MTDLHEPTATPRVRSHFPGNSPENCERTSWAGGEARLEHTLAAIAAEAAELDRAPRFPREALFHLADAGALAATIGTDRAGSSVRPEWDLVRRVAAADASVGRILDGHLNAVERLEVAADPEVRERELAGVAAGERLLGVWGADPGPGEGKPARLGETGGGLVLRGTKTFCSGAGGVDAALVMVGSDDGTAPSLVLLDCGAEVEVDHSWYRAAGLRASESHRVVFHDAPVTAVLGEPGELARDPWFSRDAMRTAASWAGMVDTAVGAALDELAARRAGDPLAHLAAGRITAMHGTVEAWLDRAATAADAGGDVRPVGIAMRAEIDRAAKAILETAAAACGSHPFVTGGLLDRARRDLETFLLQHRLDPLVGKLGAGLLEGR
jgi:alkylation response protein AidB-like acyl-CoA dehydrogenase